MGKNHLSIRPFVDLAICRSGDLLIWRFGLQGLDFRILMYRPEGTRFVLLLQINGLKSVVMRCIEPTALCCAPPQSRRLGAFHNAELQFSACPLSGGECRRHGASFLYRQPHCIHFEIQNFRFHMPSGLAACLPGCNGRPIRYSTGINPVYTRYIPGIHPARDRLRTGSDPVGIRFRSGWYPVRIRLGTGLGSWGITTF